MSLPPLHDLERLRRQLPPRIFAQAEDLNFVLELYDVPELPDLMDNPLELQADLDVVLAALDYVIEEARG